MVRSRAIDVTATTRIVRSSSCVTRSIAGETLIVPIASGTADLESIFTLNAVASRIWELLERPIAQADVAAAIAAEFDVTAADASRDVTEFIEALRTAGLVTSADGNA